MVRLRENERGKKRNIIRFQFQNGAIKSPFSFVKIGSTSEFQFQNGAIKRIVSDDLEASNM